MPNHLSLMVAATLLILGGISSGQESEPVKIPPPQRTIPRQQPSPFAAILGSVREHGGRAIPGFQMKLLDERGSVIRQADANADGIFRFLQIKPGRYRLQSADAARPYESREFQLAAGEVGTFDITVPPLTASPSQPPWRGVGPPPFPASTTIAELYRELPPAELPPVEQAQPSAPPAAAVPMPDR